jgi:DNA-binding beta-propeller fold protein YncE
MRRTLALLLLALPALALDWTKVPQLPHKLVTDWPKLPPQWNLFEAADVATDAQDNVWIFHRGKHPIIKLAKDGQLLLALDDVPVASAHGIKVGPDGGIWLIDVAGHTVMKVNGQGKVQLVIAQAGRAAAADNDAQYAFNRPTGIAFTPGGDFYVSDGYVNSRVIQFTKDGKYIRHWGRKGTGDGEFDLVHDVTVDKQGRVYVADRSNSRVQVFDAQGKFLAKWTDVGQPWGLFYVERENAIYMADGLNNRVVKLNTDGQVLGQLGGFGKAPGQFDFAHHLAVDSEGSIYVAEIKNWRVQKFAK